jgi:hypothetical protein
VTPPEPPGDHRRTTLASSHCDNPTAGGYGRFYSLVVRAAVGNLSVMPPIEPAVACHLAIIPSQSLAMKNDILQQYVSARQALLDEKAQVEARLRQITRALSEAPSAVTVAPKPVAPIPRRRRGPISMKAAVIQVTSGHPMTKPEIMAAIQKLGFRSASKNPINSLSTLLYGKNPKFRNDNGRFSPLTRATGAAGAKRATVKPSGKRKMSAAGRAKLSALIKARWAKIKKAGGKRLKAV